MQDDSRKKALDMFVRKAKGEHGGTIEKIILFGSYARGEHKKESDVDILVIWKDKLIDGWNALESIATDILIEHDVLLSLKVIAPRDYETMLNLGMPFIKNIQDEGTEIG